MPQSKAFVTSLAKGQLKESFEWYENQQLSLGEEFRSEVKDCIDKLTRGNVDHRIYYRSVRKVALRRFPYHVYYKREPERVVVIAVFHVKRNPEEIKKLLRG